MSEFGKDHLSEILADEPSQSYQRLLDEHTIVAGDPSLDTIAVAIPHFNGSALAHVGLFNIIDDPRVSEIVVLDDCSSSSEFAALRDKLKPFAAKVKLHRREQNFGPMPNKMQAVSLCEADWVVVLDYDNTLSKDYLDTIFALPERDKQTIYCPSFAAPKFSFRSRFGDKQFDFAGIYAQFQSQAENNYPISVCLNTGNYFVPRQRFCEVISPFWDVAVHAADVIFANYLWLSAGNNIKILKDSWYHHRVHAGSSWINSKSASAVALEKMSARIMANELADSAGMPEFERLGKTWSEPVAVAL